MALEEFWNDVRSRNPLFRNPISPPDAPRITSEDLDAELRNNEAAWCPRGPLRGFDSRDFDFLPPEDLARLSGWVNVFNAIAPELRTLWGKTRNAEDEKRFMELTELAVNPLRELLLFFAHDRYLDADAFHFGKLVERELGDQLPEGIAELRFLVGQDWSGDPAFYAWAFVSEESTSTDEKLLTISRHARPLIQDAMQRVASQYFVYLSFRGVGESVAQDEDEEVTV